MKRHALPDNPHPEDLHLVVETFKALSDATRARLVLLLQQERSVGELVELLKQPQSTVSRHLAVLRSMDLVDTRREGPSVYYHLPDTHLGELMQQAFSHAQHKRMKLSNHPSNLELSDHPSKKTKPRRQ